jgi:hypothetical protein
MSWWKAPLSVRGRTEIDLGSVESTQFSQSYESLIKARSVRTAKVLRKRNILMMLRVSCARNVVTIAADVHFLVDAMKHLIKTLKKVDKHNCSSTISHYFMSMTCCTMTRQQNNIFISIKNIFIETINKSESDENSWHLWLPWSRDVITS